MVFDQWGSRWQVPLLGTFIIVLGTDRWGPCPYHAKSGFKLHGSVKLNWLPKFNREMCSMSSGRELAVICNLMVIGVWATKKRPKMAASVSVEWAMKAQHFLTIFVFSSYTFLTSTRASSICHSLICFVWFFELSNACLLHFFIINRIPHKTLY